MADDSGPWTKYAAPPADPAPASEGPWTKYAAPAHAPPTVEWGPIDEAANAVLMGAGPALEGAGAYLRGGDYGAAKAAAEQAQAAYGAAYPIASTAAELVGGAVPAAAMTAVGIPPVAAGAVQGGANGYAQQGAPGAIIGGGLGAAGAGLASLAGRGLTALGRAAHILPEAAPTAPVVPTPQQGLDAGGQGFDAMRATGAEFPAADVRGGANAQATALADRGIYGDVGPSGAPTTYALLAKQAALGAQPATDPMQAMTGVVAPQAPAVPIERLDAIRTALGGVRPSGTTSMRDASAARQAAEGILGLYENHGVPGNATKVVINGKPTYLVNGQVIPTPIADLSANARGNYAAGMTGRALEDYAEAAANGAQNTGIGMNAGNKFRQAAGAAIKSDDFDAQPDVRAALQQANDGSAFQNLMRRTGTALGGGGGPLSTLLALSTPGMAAAAGYGSAGLPGLLLGAIPPTIGHIAKSVDNRMAREAFQNAIDTAMKRSPLYAQNAANFVPPAPPVVPGGIVPTTLGGLFGAYATATAPAQLQ